MTVADDIVWELRKHGSLSMMDLGIALNQTKSNISKGLSKLEGIGEVMRTTDGHRNVFYKLREEPQNGSQDYGRCRMDIGYTRHPDYVRRTSYTLASDDMLRMLSRTTEGATRMKVIEEMSRRGLA